MKRTLLALCLTLWAAAAQAQVVFDAKGTADCLSNGVAGTTGISCSTLTVGSGSNRGLVCLVSMGLHTPTSEALVWDSGGSNQSMTQLLAANNTSTQGRVEVWGLVAPTSGAKVAKFTWNAATSDVVLDCLSFTGVDQTGGATSFPHSTSATGTGTATSLAVTSATGNYTVEVGSNNTNVYTAQTQTLAFRENGANDIGAQGQYATGAATVTHGGTIASSAAWVSGGTDILAAGGGGGGGCTAKPTLMLMGVGNCGG